MRLKGDSCNATAAAADGVKAASPANEDADEPGPGGEPQEGERMSDVVGLQCPARAWDSQGTRKRTKEARLTPRSSHLRSA